MKYYILFNPLAHSGTGKENAEKLNEILSGNTLIYKDVTQNSYRKCLSEITAEDKIVICGGDGTLNRFINETQDITLQNEIYCYPTGSGNDFIKDIYPNGVSEPVKINEYLENLPTVTVNGKTSRFLNGIGYGIDGYCCEVGDIQRKKSDKPVNYTSIAIKGLLFHYKTTSATVIVDGQEYNFKNVWLAPTMNGRCYGGGMIPTPDQDRLNTDGTLSTMVYYTKSKLKALMVFPTIFKGEHVKKEKMVKIFKGKNITVKFDRPTALQIDGETVLNVTECTMASQKA